MGISLVKRIEKPDFVSPEVDLDEVHRRGEALEKFRTKHPEKWKELEGRWVLVEENKVYQLKKFDTEKDATIYYEGFGQKHLTSPPMYVHRSNEVFMGVFGYVKVA